MEIKDIVLKRNEITKQHVNNILENLKKIDKLISVLSSILNK